MPYKRYIPITTVVISFLILYHHVIVKLVHDWSSDDNYSHGFLVPLISCFILWQNRNNLFSTKKEASNTGLLFLIISCLFFVAAHVGAELFTMRLSMIMVIWSAVLYLAGWPFAKATFPPIAYLIFMIPLPAIVWNKIAFPLKLFATRMAVEVIKFLSITVYSEGNVIYLPNTTLEVVDACSGLRSLTSLLALSAAFALIADHSGIKKIILFLSAIPFAILLNIVRLSSTAVLSKYFGPEIAQGFLHEASGILVFMLALILLYYFNKLLSKAPPSPIGSEHK